MDSLGPKSQEFLEKFGINFLKSYGISAFLKIKSDVEAEANPDPRHLQYRDWSSVPSNEIRGGFCFVQDGDGPGNMSGWSRYFLKAMPDNNLGAFGNEKAAADPKGKPKFVIPMAGYTVESAVTNYYSSAINELAAELECEAEEVGYSDYSWSLTHPTRKNYIMQLHKGEGGGPCACIGGNKVQPADSGSEHAEAVQDWIDLCEELAANSSPRDLSGNVLSMAFERTVQKMSAQMDELDGFTDDGTEGEILTDMAFIALVDKGIRPELVENAKNAPMGKMGIFMKTRGTTVTVINKVMDPGWKAMQKQADELYKKIEPTIKAGLEPILKKKLELQDKLKEKTGGKIGDVLGKKVTPHLKPIFDAFDKPMKEGLKLIEEIYSEEVDAIAGADATEFSAKVTSDLDQIPRTKKKVKKLKDAASKMTKPLKELKKLDKDNFLDQLDPSDAKSVCYFKMVELLDAMMFTTEQLMKDKKNLKDVRKEVLSAYKYDSAYTIQQFVASTVVGIFVTKVRSLLGEFVDPLLDPIKEAIPEDLQEILDVEAEFMFLLDAFIGEPINKMLSANYPLPK